MAHGWGGSETGKAALLVEIVTAGLRRLGFGRVVQEPEGLPVCPECGGYHAEHESIVHTATYAAISAQLDYRGANLGLAKSLIYGEE